MEIKNKHDLKPTLWSLGVIEISISSPIVAIYIQTYILTFPYLTLPYIALRCVPLIHILYVCIYIYIYTILYNGENIGQSWLSIGIAGSSFCDTLTEIQGVHSSFWPSLVPSMALNGLPPLSGNFLATHLSVLQNTALGNDAILSDIDAGTCSTARNQQPKVAMDSAACLKATLKHGFSYEKCLLGQPSFTVRGQSSLLAQPTTMLEKYTWGDNLEATPSVHAGKLKLYKVKHPQGPMCAAQTTLLAPTVT